MRMFQGGISMAKKTDKKTEIVEEEVKEEKAEKAKYSIITDKHGFEWKVDAEGNKIERV